MLDLKLKEQTMHCTLSLIEIFCLILTSTNLTNTYYASAQCENNISLFFSDSLTNQEEIWYLFLPRSIKYSCRSWSLMANRFPRAERWLISYFMFLKPSSKIKATKFLKLSYTIIICIPGIKKSRRTTFSRPTSCILG